MISNMSSVFGQGFEHYVAPFVLGNAQLLTKKIILSAINSVVTSAARIHVRKSELETCLL